MDDVQLDTVQLDTSHSQHLNSGKSPGIVAVCDSGQLHHVQMNNNRSRLLFFILSKLYLITYISNIINIINKTNLYITNISVHLFIFTL